MTKSGVHGDSDTTGSHGEGMQNSLGFTLAQLGMETSRRFSSVVGEFGLEPRDFAVLFATSDEPDQSQQAVGERLSIPASSMVAIVDRLEAGGFVERRAHATDRRTRSLRLTASGQRVLAKTLDAAARHEATIARGLHERERATLLTLLRRVAENLDVPDGALPDRGSGRRRAP